MTAIRVLISYKTLDEKIEHVYYKEIKLSDLDPNELILSALNNDLIKQNKYKLWEISFLLPNDKNPYVHTYEYLVKYGITNNLT